MNIPILLKAVGIFCASLAFVAALAIWPILISIFIPVATTIIGVGVIYVLLLPEDHDDYR